MRIRPFETGDEMSILDLFESSFNRPIDQAWWRWRYLENPIDKPRILLAFDGATLAGHYAVLPIELTIRSEPRLAALSVATMTNAGYRGKGVFEKLANALYGELEREGYFGVFGFPNSLSHLGFVKKLGWREICAQHSLTLTRGTFQPSVASKGWQFETIAASDARLAAPTASPQGVRMVWRDAAWKWRISPPIGEAYKAEIATPPDGAHTTATIVWKRYGSNSIDLVHYEASELEPLASLVNHIATSGFSSGVTLFNTWASLYDPAHHVFERAGFRAEGPVTYFAGRVFSGEDVAYDPRDWRLTMLSSDVY